MPGMLSSQTKVLGKLLSSLWSLIKHHLLSETILTIVFKALTSNTAITTPLFYFCPLIGYFYFLFLKIVYGNRTTQSKVMHMLKYLIYSAKMISQKIAPMPRLKKDWFNAKTILIINIKY